MYIYLALFTSSRKVRTLDLPLGLGQAKPSQLCGKNVKASIFDISCGRGCIISLLWTFDPDGPLHIGTINVIAHEPICMKLILFIFPCRLKINHWSPWEPCIYSWERCCRKQLLVCTCSWFFYAFTHFCVSATASCAFLPWFLLYGCYICPLCCDLSVSDVLACFRESFDKENQEEAGDSSLPSSEQPMARIKSSGAKVFHSLQLHSRPSFPPYIPANLQYSH